MARDSIFNEATGERVAFLTDTPDLLVMEAEWTRPGRRTSEHVHPRMEERWTVLEGRAAFRIAGGPEVEAGPGETMIAPPGVAHVAWNPTEGPVRLRIEMRPALRWRAFVERLFATRGRPDPDLLGEFAAEVRPC